MAAMALKLFSVSPQTKKMYRFIGNTLGARMRVHRGLSKSYIDRAKLILEVDKKYYPIRKDDRLLEIGTGWVQWESTIIRLFYDVEIHLFDICNNRQLAAVKHYFAEFGKLTDKEIGIDLTQNKRVQNLLQSISKVSSFDELYRLLGFKYIVNPSGVLDKFQDNSFNVIFSSSVLEHIDKNILSKYIQDLYRLLKPGGYSIHRIDLGDHLSYYDRSVSKKNYLRYSDKIWKRYFENQIQYFNRVQRPEWLNLFRRVGFSLIEDISLPCDIGIIKIDKKYENINKKDLECRTLLMIHRKPK